MAEDGEKERQQSIRQKALDRTGLRFYTKTCSGPTEASNVSAGVTMRESHITTLRSNTENGNQSRIESEAQLSLEESSLAHATETYTAARARSAAAVRRVSVLSDWLSGPTRSMTLSTICGTRRA